MARTKIIQVVGSLKGKGRIVDIPLPAAKWVGDASPYSQVITVEGITEFSQVDLTPSVMQLAIFYEKDLGFVSHNASAHERCLCRSRCAGSSGVASGK